MTLAVDGKVNPVFGIDPVLYEQFLNWREQIIPDLTSYMKKDKNLCMKGKVRTKEKCQKCDGKFIESNIAGRRDLWCPSCLTHPTRYFVDICWKRQYKIYSDQDGRVLDSFLLASRLLNEIRQKIDKHTFEPKDYISSTIKPPQFETNIHEWLQRQQKRLDLDDIAPSYYEKIEHITKNYFIPYFLKRDVRDIRTADIQDFQLSLPEKLKPKTQLNIMSLLHKYFRDLYDREEIKRLPKFKRIEVPDPHWNWVDVEEQEAIFIHIPEKHRPIFTFMMFQGCRPGEARALWREDINFYEGTDIIRRSFSNDVYRKTTKTKRERLIPLHEEVVGMLKKLPILNGFIFIDPNTGKPYRKYRLNRIFDRARRLAGIENLTLYQWSKHSFCSQAINRGAPHKLVNEMVGTKSERASRRYQHVNVTGLRLTLRKRAAKIIHMEEKNYG